MFHIVRLGGVVFPRRRFSSKWHQIDAQNARRGETRNNQFTTVRSI